jgi:hypothetical protein
MERTASQKRLIFMNRDLAAQMRGRHIAAFAGHSGVFLTSLFSPEEVDTNGVIKKQIVRVLTQDVCGLFGEQGIRDDERGSGG